MSKSTTLKFSIRTLLVIVFLAAAGIAIFREFYVPPLDQIDGLSVLQTRKRGHDVVFDQHATRRTADQLVSHLEEQTSLWFYDSVYESPSDPGAFVEILLHEGEYLVELANHGWSTDWFPVTRDEAVQYIWACRADNGPDRSQSLLDEGMWLRQDVEPPQSINRDAGYKAAQFVRQRIR